MPDAVDIAPPEEAPAEPGEREAADRQRRERRQGRGAHPRRARASCSATSGPARCTRCRRSSRIDHGAVPTTPRRRLRRRLARLLVDHADRLDQVRHVHHARRQRRRGRHHGPDRARPARPAPRPRAARARPLGVVGASLFYGDGMITPAISVLVGGRGPEGRRAEPRAPRHPDHARDPRRPVRDPALGDAPRRPGVRAGDGGLVRDPRARRPARGRSRTPSILKGALAHLRRRVRRRPPAAWRSSRMGAVVLAITGAEALYADMGHFGRRADPPRLVPARLPGADAQLPRPGRADPRTTPAPSRTRSSCCCRTGRASRWCVARDDGHRDRLAGGHLRRLLDQPPGDAARLPAAPDDPPHLRARDRPDLRARPSTGASSPRSSCSSSASAPRPRWRRPTASRSPARFMITTILFLVVARCCGTGRRGRSRRSARRLPHRRARVLRGQPDQDLPRRLAAARRSRRRLHGPDDLAARPADRHGQPHGRGGPAAASSSRAARARRRRCSASPARRCSSTRRSRPRRSLCAPTSSTTTSCTSSVVIVSVRVRRACPTSRTPSA